MSSNPKLIDLETGSYLMQTLNMCHTNRVTTYSSIFNIAIVVLFVFVTCTTLYLCNKRKKTEAQKKNQVEQEQKFILEKIRALKEQKQHYFEQTNTTHLPVTHHQIKEYDQSL